jgi:carbon starvation protein
MQELARNAGEQTLFYRTGGAPSLALGMAHIFAHTGGKAVIGFWYHFAIMFEALFILTIIAAGTRVGRFMLQDLLRHAQPSFGRMRWLTGMMATSSFIVFAWGYFLYQGVRDPLGGINALWPLFGIANQLLAAIALCVATTILIKMHGARYIWITGLPLVWLVIVTFTAAWQKIFSPAPRIGFLAQASQLEAALQSGAITGAKIAQTQTLIFNARLDAVLCAVFLILVAVILIDSVRIWTGVLRGTRESSVAEAPFVPSRLSTEEA